MSATTDDDTTQRRLTPGSLTHVDEPGTAVVAADDYGADAGAGFEDVQPDEMIIPFKRILQTNSPQCEEGNPLYVDGAKAGMIINTSTSELYDGKVGLPFVPVRRDHNYVEYVPRDAGGGFVSIWAPDDPRIAALRKAQGQFGKLKLESGNELAETFYFYELDACPDGQLLRAVTAFASTQIKSYKMVTTRLAGLIGTPPRFPLFAWRWRATTALQKNKKGTFYGWRITLDGDTPDDARLPANSDLYAQAKSFFQLLKDGAAKADYAQAGTPDADGGEEIPF